MIDFLKDLWDFMRERKKFWLAPIILVMLLLAVRFRSKISMQPEQLSAEHAVSCFFLGA